MIAIFIVFAFAIILGSICSDSTEEKVIYDESLRKTEGYKWFIGSFENRKSNTIFCIAFVAKNEDHLLAKIKRFTRSKEWVYDGTIPIAEVSENEIYRLENVSIKI